MAKKGSLKKSLLASALSLTLSASMLIGTTFAWFTDGVTNAGNKIQAGTLDIDLYDVTTGTEVEVTETSAPLFKYEKWEPGYKASKVLKVQNNGTLALKFRMDIMKTASVGTADICDVIEVWATAPATTYDVSNYEWQTDYTYCGTLNQMMAEGDGAIHGTLLEGESAYQGIVLKMSEEAGNEYQGAIAEFDIALRATQFTYESDSYDDTYDADATYTSTYVKVPTAGTPAQDVTLKANDEVGVEVTLPAETMENLPVGVTSVALAYTEPVVDTTTNTITFDSVEVVDQNGHKVNLDGLSGEKVEVALPAPAIFNDGDLVFIYHDGEHVATTTVAGGMISYSVEHLCEISVSTYYEGEDVKDWTGTEGVWEISNVAEMFRFAQMVNGGDNFAGQQVVLTEDVDLAGMDWTPIGSKGKEFKGDFDGQEHTIKNLAINCPEQNCVGLFGAALNTDFKNVTIENANIVGYSKVGTLVGEVYTGCTIENCHVTGEINLSAEWAYVGGIYAYGYISSVKDCSVIATTQEAGTIVSKTRNAVGGIAAWGLEGAHTIEGCAVKNLALTGWANIGAIAGFAHYGNVITNCSAEDVVMTKTRQDGNPTIGLAAGGWSYNAKHPITVTNNSFKNITLNGTYLPIASANILYGAEYGGGLNSNFVTDNNEQENIVNNLVEVQVINSVEGLKNAFATGGKYALANSVGGEDWTLEVTESLIVPAGVSVELYLNGKTIAGSYENVSNANKTMFDVRGTLTIEGSGLVTMKTTGINMGWNAMGCTICVNGGDLYVNNATIANEGGTDMSFAIDTNPWNDKSNAELNVELNNVKVTSPYRAIRVRDNGPYLVKLVANDSFIDMIWYQEYDTNYGLLVEVILNNTVANTDRVDDAVLTIN